MSSKIYELDQKAIELTERLEWLDPNEDREEYEAIWAELNRVTGDAIGYLKWCSNVLAQLQDEAAVQDSLKSAFYERYKKQAKKAEERANNVERFKDMMLSVMGRFDISEVKGDFVKVKKSKRLGVEILDSCDLSQLPSEFVTEIPASYKVDKTKLNKAVLDAFKADGDAPIIFKGVMVVEKESLRVY